MDAPNRLLLRPIQILQPRLGSRGQLGGQWLIRVGGDIRNGCQQERNVGGDGDGFHAATLMDSGVWNLETRLGAGRWRAAGTARAAIGCPLQLGAFAAGVCRATGALPDTAAG